MSGLQGKAIVVTRAPHQADALALLLAEAGAMPVFYPCVDIAPPDDPAPLDAALRAAERGEFDWLALTSANAAWAVSRRLAELGLPLTILHGLRLAAVGPATAAAARDTLGLEVDVIPDEFSSAALAQVLTPLAEARVLLPLSSLAETTLTDALRAQGALVTCVVAYQTVIGSGGVDLPLLLRREEIDAITLTSSSAATNLRRRVLNEGGDETSLRQVPIGCIGARTAETARATGLACRGGSRGAFARRTGRGSGRVLCARGDNDTTGGRTMTITEHERSLAPARDTTHAQFPVARPRRLRLSPGIRRLARETTLSAADFIYPLFVRYGANEKRPIGSMPGQFQWSVDRLPDEIGQIAALGIPAVMLFGVPATKDAIGSGNYDPEGVTPQAIRAIKAAAPEMVVISDMCFCEYTDHGHCGIINTPDAPHYTPRLPEGYVMNDLTLDLLARASVTHAEAGADIIAPSGMIDGMVGAIRAGLDANGFDHVAILSYAAKYASGFYGPFREAAESPPQFGDRSQYQMDPANRREALREVALDVAEGADMLMVKPALPYLDVLSAVRQAYDLPLAAYQVSGEYAMLHAAAANGWLDLRRCALESLIGIKRAGADMILTYFAKDAATWLAEGA